MSMRRVPLIVIAALGVLALVVAGCGGGGKAKKGGTVTILDTEGGIDSLDPGYWYYQDDNVQLMQTTQRQLYAWPDNATSPAPDLATALPVVRMMLVTPSWSIPKKLCGERAEIMASNAICRLPSVPFLNPTGMDRPEAISRCG